MKKINKIINIDGRKIGEGYPTYFIADIASNHDGDLSRAKDLIWKAKESGADAAKFQHFKAETIVSDAGFKSLGTKFSHQVKWARSVFEVYKDASVSLEWTETLKNTCKQAGITFFTSPYAMDIADYMDPYVPAYKIGSGDITWLEIIEHVAKKGKPLIIATGASTIEDVDRAVEAACKYSSDVAILQCNTNYTGDIENFKFINLNVIKSYINKYKDIVVGLSDHTPGHACVLGAIAIGARIIEKHFTDDRDRNGPDHEFSMDPGSWMEMVQRSRELEYALGSDVKRIENNETDTVILQRRSLRLNCDLQDNEEIKENHLTVLRPCPKDAIEPFDKHKVVGKHLQRPKRKGDYLTWSDLK